MGIQSEFQAGIDGVAEVWLRGIAQRVRERLTVGDVRQTVEVAAAAPLLETNGSNRTPRLLRISTWLKCWRRRQYRPRYCR